MLYCRGGQQHELCELHFRQQLRQEPFINDIFCLFYCFYFCSSNCSRLVMVGSEPPFFRYLLKHYSCSALCTCKLPECCVILLQAICMSHFLATPVL